MSVSYVCRHCGMHLGEIKQSVSEHDLGFHTLTPEEKEDIIQYGQHGQMIARVTCEHCQEAIERNPEALLMNRIHQ